MTRLILVPAVNAAALVGSLVLAVLDAVWPLDVPEVRK